MGQIELNITTDLTSLPQDAASAMCAITISGLVGATYKPLLYIGKQVAKGTNYWFIAEQTLVTQNTIKRIVKLKVNAFNGIYALVPTSIEDIFA